MLHVIRDTCDVQDKIPCTLITDSMAAALMAAGKVTAVVAGLAARLPAGDPSGASERNCQWFNGFCQSNNQT